MFHQTYLLICNVKKESLTPYSTAADGINPVMFHFYQHVIKFTNKFLFEVSNYLVFSGPTYSDYTIAAYVLYTVQPKTSLLSIFSEAWKGTRAYYLEMS